MQPFLKRMRFIIRTYNYCEDSSFIPPRSGTHQKGNKTMTRFRPRGFIFGIGGYAGLNIFNEQRFKRPFESGEIVQEVNFNDFNYGISSYLSFPYLVTIYGKLDTSPLFTNQVEPLYNLSLGIRIGIN